MKLKPTFCVTGLPPVVGVGVGSGFATVGVAVRCGAGVAVRVALGPPLSFPLLPQHPELPHNSSGRRRLAICLTLCRISVACRTT